MVHKSGQIFLPFCHNSRVWQTDGRTEFSSLGLHYMQRGKNIAQLLGDEAISVPPTQTSGGGGRVPPVPNGLTPVMTTDQRYSSVLVLLLSAAQNPQIVSIISEAAKTLIHAFISSRLNNWKSFLQCVMMAIFRSHSECSCSCCDWNCNQGGCL